jgi:hypothetical protein
MLSITLDTRINTLRLSDGRTVRARYSGCPLRQIRSAVAARCRRYVWPPRAPLQFALMRLHPALLRLLLRSGCRHLPARVDSFSLFPVDLTHHAMLAAKLHHI